MPSLRKIVQISAIAVFALAGTVVGKWYHTAALETIDPQSGIYGMAGLELWIDLNARMPGFAREWGCNTLRAREKLVLGGQNSLAPYSCQPGFGTLPDATMYETVANANLAQVAAGLDEGQIAALRACFDGKMASAVTPDDIASVNDDPASEAMTKVILAVAEAVRACKAAQPGSP